MKKNTERIIIVLLLFNLIFSCVLGVTFYRICFAQPDDVKTQYIMYVGINDRDTYEQIISTDDAKAIINTICHKYLEGYTVQEAVGSWTDEKGIPTHENTVVCYFNDASEEEVYEIADEVLKELNQNKILIVKNSVKIDFYGEKSQ